MLDFDFWREHLIPSVVTMNVLLFVNRKTTFWLGLRFVHKYKSFWGGFPKT